MAITPEVFIDKTNEFIDKIEVYLEKTDDLITNVSSMLEFNKRTETKRDKREIQKEKREKKSEKFEESFVKKEDANATVNKNLKDIKEVLKSDKKEKKDTSFLSFFSDLGGGLKKGLMGPLGFLMDHPILSALMGAGMFTEAGREISKEMIKVIISAAPKIGKEIAKNIIVEPIKSAKNKMDELSEEAKAGNLDKILSKKSQERVKAGKGGLWNLVKEPFVTADEKFNELSEKAKTGNLDLLKSLPKKKKTPAEIKQQKRIAGFAALAEKYGGPAGIPPEMILGLIQQESGGIFAERSDTGAKGITQIIPGTEKFIEDLIGEELDLTKEEDAIKGTTAYLKHLMKKSGKKNPKDALRWAIGRYLGTAEKDMYTGLPKSEYIDNIYNYSEDYSGLFGTKKAEAFVGPPKPGLIEKETSKAIERDRGEFLDLWHGAMESFKADIRAKEDTTSQALYDQSQKNDDIKTTLDKFVDMMEEFKGLMKDSWNKNKTQVQFKSQISD